MGVDFGIIGSVAARCFDTDYMDIRRDINGRLSELYSNVPCHLSFHGIDNPNPETVDIKPVVQSMSVHCGNWVDVRNNDYLVVKRMDAQGGVLAVYSGRCGNPVASQGRQEVQISMNDTDEESPTVPPPKNPSMITVRHLCGGEEIKGASEYAAETGGSWEMTAPEIDGYRAVGAVVDGEEQSGGSAVVSPVTEGGHEVAFLYEESAEGRHFRFLVNGLYKKDNGSLARGWHLFGRVAVLGFEDNGGGLYRIRCENARLVNPSSGKTVSVEPGCRIVLMPGDVYARVSEVEDYTDGVSFAAEEYEPSEEERKAYDAKWYG